MNRNAFLDFHTIFLLRIIVVRTNLDLGTTQLAKCCRHFDDGVRGGEQVRILYCRIDQIRHPAMRRIASWWVKTLTLGCWRLCVT